MRLELELGTEAAAGGGFVAPGFDATRIVAVGVKMALGDDPGARFDGAFYLDAVDW